MELYSNTWSPCTINFILAFFSTYAFQFNAFRRCAWRNTLDKRSYSLMRPSRHLFCFSSPVLGDIRNELETSTISLWSEVRDLLVVFLPVDANRTAPPGQCGQMQWDASSVAYVLSRIGRNLFANMADRRLPPSVDRLCPVGRTRGNSDRFECLPASQKHLIIEMTSASHSWALVERPTSPHATYLFSQVEHARLRQISAQAAEMMRHRLG